MYTIAHSASPPIPAFPSPLHLLAILNTTQIVIGACACDALCAACDYLVSNPRSAAVWAGDGAQTREVSIHTTTAHLPPPNTLKHTGAGKSDTGVFKHGCLATIQAIRRQLALRALTSTLSFWKSGHCLLVGDARPLLCTKSDLNSSEMGPTRPCSVDDP